MRFKKLLAGMTAAAMLANFGTGAFAESAVGIPTDYTLPMLSAVAEGYLASLETGSTYEINLKQVCGGANPSEITSVNVSVEGVGTATVYLDYDFNNELKSVKLGAVNTDSVDLDLTDKGIDWAGSNYRLRFATGEIDSGEIGGSVKILAVYFKNSADATVGSIIASDLVGISWQTNALSNPVSLDEWNHFFYTNKDIRLSTFDVRPGDWIKVTCHVTNAENGGATLAVNGYNDGFEYVNVPDSGEVYVRVTDAMVNNGIEFRGWNVTIDSVQFQSAKEVQDARITEKVLFVGSAELVVDHEAETQEGYVAPHMTCGRVNAQEGDIIRVEFAEIGEEGGWFRLHDRGWADICGDSFICIRRSQRDGVHA